MSHTSHLHHVESVVPGVGVICMDSPPVNSLGTELVTSFKQEFPKLVQDPKASRRARIHVIYT